MNNSRVGVAADGQCGQSLQFDERILDHRWLRAIDEERAHMMGRDSPHNLPERLSAQQPAILATDDTDRDVAPSFDRGDGRGLRFAGGWHRFDQEQINPGGSKSGGVGPVFDKR
jgi:hypothetical protein